MKHSDFKYKARLHQIDFKCNNSEINVDATKYYIRKFMRNGKEYSIPVESSLRWEDCKDGEGNYRIFFSGFRKELTEEANRQDVLNKTQMVTNLLRSEHIPYNIFFPMNNDREGTTRLFNRILGGDRIEKVNFLCIEYNPGGLKDRTAFDFYIEYTPKGGLPGAKGGIGIEVKYTEKEYPIKKNSKEWNETHNKDGIHLHTNYRQPSETSGWFKKEYIEDVPYSNTERLANHVVANDYRQIWRNHILGASMVLGLCTAPKDKLSEFTSLTVYPAENGHFADVWGRYESKLTDEGLKTFKHITYEELFFLMKECLSPIKIPQLPNWLKYLNERYLFT